jgi:hypothetical protein
MSRISDTKFIHVESRVYKSKPKCTLQIQPGGSINKLNYPRLSENQLRIQNKERNDINDEEDEYSLEKQQRQSEKVTRRFTS